MKAIRSNIDNGSGKTRLMAKFGLAAILGAGLALGSIANVAQADPRDHRYEHRDDRGHQFDRDGFRGDHRHHQRISERCADHPRACARHHAHRAAKHEYRHTMREIRRYRHHHGYVDYRPHRHHRYYDRDAMLFLPMPGQIMLRVDLR